MRDFSLLSSIAPEIEEIVESGGNLSINGPQVIAEFELFGATIQLTESVTVQWFVMIVLGLLFFILGRNLKVKPEGKRQAIAEMVVSTFKGMVKDNMGESYSRYTPYIATLFCFSLGMSLSCLFGFRPPTADISVIAAWGVVTFILVTRNRWKSAFANRRVGKGFLHYVNPLNIVSEISNPMSMSLRHYGNILAGVVIGGIIYWALGSFAVIIPAAASLYFDIFASVLQAFIFITLTMVYVAMSEIEPKPEKQ
jgi:F-type H+-transporting ATPase subunit a